MALPKLAALRAKIAKATARGVLDQGDMPSQPSPLALVAKAQSYLATYLAATKASAAGAMARALHRDYDHVAARAAAETMACRRGCAWCCHNRVTAMAPELFRLADAIRRRPDREAVIARIDAENAITQGMTLEQRYAAQRPCPLLSDENACGLYEDRPLTCRAWASSSAVACEQAHGDPAVQIPFLDKRMYFRAGYSFAFRAALSALSWPIAGYELTEGLARVVRDPSAEPRWIAGEPVLDGVQVDDGLPDEHKAFIREVAEEAVK